MGPVLRPDGGEDSFVEAALPSPNTVRQLLLDMGYRPAHVRHMAVFREGLRLPHDTPLVDAETVVIAVPFGGG